MQFECSYDAVYDELTDSEEMKLQVDSVALIPKDCQDSDALYTVATSELGQVKITWQSVSTRMCSDYWQRLN